VALPIGSSDEAPQPLPPAVSGAVSPSPALVEQHAPRPGHPGWLPWARHRSDGEGLVFDSRCASCRDALADYIVRRHAPSELVLRLLRKLSQED
jgi:hypothetical protein